MDTPASPAPTLPSSTLTSILTMVATKGLAALAAVLVTHGLMAGNDTEALIAIAPALVSIGWSAWLEYLRPTLIAQLEVLKAKSLAQAAAMQARSVPKVTIAQIAAQSPTMDPAAVVKAIATLPPAVQDAVATPPFATTSVSGPKAVIALALATAALGLLCPGVAHAQTRTPTARPALCDLDPLKLTPGCQVTPDLITAVKAAISGQPSTSTATSACDFNLFVNLSATNVIAQIQQCLATPAAGIANALLPDVTAALASATNYADLGGDSVGVACLKPGLEIIKAGVGTPAVPGVPGVPAVPAVPATGTTPEIPAVPAVIAIAAVPAYLPGPILIFQKFREFELAGGPAACKTWVMNTVAGANPLTQ